MSRETTPAPSSHRTPLARRLTVGPASVAVWLALLLLLTAALPLLLAISVFDRRRQHRSLRAFWAWCLRLFFLRFLGAIRYHRVAERPAPDRVRSLAPCVFTANHRSWLDGILALALFPGVLVPVSGSYARIPVLGLVIRWSGGIPIDRAEPAAIVDGVHRAGRLLAAGHSLFVFPEGTRGRGRGIGPFSDFFFRLARDRGVPVVPVVMHSDALALSPGAPGFLPRRRARWRIRILEPIIPDRRDRPADLARRARAGIGAALAALDGEDAADHTGREAVPDRGENR